jgi:hypothetical protein
MAWCRQPPGRRYRFDVDLLLAGDSTKPIA